MADYRSIYERSLADPAGFWGEAARDIDWYKPWSKVFDGDLPPAGRWFVSGELNTCHNALDRHIAAGAGDRLALIYDSPVTGQKRRYTYRELRDEVARLAGVLVAHGIGKGDRVLIYMPMIPRGARGAARGPLPRAPSRGVGSWRRAARPEAGRRRRPAMPRSARCCGP